MEADLSRLIGQLYDTPYWRYVLASLGDEQRRKFGREFHDRVVKAGRIADLPPDISEMIDLGEASSKIAKRYNLDPVQPEQLAQIMEKLNASSK